MAHNIYSDRLAQAQIVDLVVRERSKALSVREWRHRLAGFGYSIRATAQGNVIETVPHGRRVCALPEGLAV